ncbi:YggT family protein [Caloranaerobacter azorensis]|uniref:YggT family protein n=2 Tax=Caloranaerobacter azorensis TaxID=116090 RepID=A0A1M5V2Q7_9FIRM|nr:YggT family protein [Caloranaerobacter azorensis]QIB26669.1 YggT family protein [Caloranaerobacter azorensis]SHH69388.1 YggT family protein [Caloranaerobacter azorensis DSM 13643]
MWVIERSVGIFINLLETLILVRVFMSYIIRDLNNPVFNFVYQVTEPILSPFRDLMDKLGINTGMIDFSPLLAFVFLDLISYILRAIL